MDVVLGIAAGGAAVTAVIAIIITLRFARNRAERGDAMEDRWSAKVVELDVEKAGHASTKHALTVANENNAKLQAVLETQKAELARVELAVKTTEEQLHDLIAKSVTNAPIAAVVTAAAREAAELRALVSRLRSQAQAVPGVPGPSTPAAGDQGGGEDRRLPDAPDERRDPVP